MTNTELLVFLKSKGACYGAIEWLGSRDLAAAWAECPRGDWLLWLAGRANSPDAVRLRLAACDCAELALPVYEAQYPGDARPREAIETARRFARGAATEQELSVAKSSAWSAARSAARSAAWSAAESAWSAAESAAESVAAWSAESAWSVAVSAAEAESAAWSAARDARLRECAEIARKYWPEPPDLGGAR